MYVFMYVCMHAYMHVCMFTCVCFICKYACIHRRIDSKVWETAPSAGGCLLSNGQTGCVSVSFILM